MQVAGFERHQLSTLFSGIMSHLLAHVSNALAQQQQQQQQGGTAADAAAQVRRRRLTGKGASQTSAAAAAAAAAATSATGAVSVQAYCQQVAAALAAHLSARVPFNSSLVPHVLHILKDDVSVTQASELGGCCYETLIRGGIQHISEHMYNTDL
jgi:hypothetical protein